MYKDPPTSRPGGTILLSAKYMSWFHLLSGNSVVVVMYGLRERRYRGCCKAA